jgi:hypothetical protein
MMGGFLGRLWPVGERACHNREPGAYWITP